jgi:PAS domain S-box-containing protein
MGIRKRVFLLLPIVFVPLLLLEAFTFYEWYQDRLAAEIQANLELARAVAKNFETFLQDVVHSEMAVGLALTSSGSMTNQDRDRLLDAFQPVNPALRSIFWMNTDGLVVSSSLRSYIGFNLSDRSFFQEVKEGRDWAASELIVGKATGRPGFTVSRAIRNDRGELTGITAAAVEPDSLYKVLGVVRSKEAAISIVDNKGMLVFTYPMDMSKITLDQRKWPESYPALGNLLKGKEITTVVFSRVYQHRRLAAFVPIPSIGWIATAERPESDVNKTILAAVSPQAAVVFLVTLAAFGGAIVLSRPISASIVRLRNLALALGQGEMERIDRDEAGPGELKNLSDTMNEMAEKIRVREAALKESEQRWAITLSSIGDAVIATDVAGRIAFMNSVAEEMTGWTHQEASSMPITEVFNIISEHTRGTVESPVARVLREGMVVGLANHTILVRKDGAEIPIDDSGAPIRDNDGNTVGVVLVFRDITERKRAEERTAHLASYPQLNPNPIIEVDVSGGITFCNPATPRILKDIGLSEEECEGFLPEDLETILQGWDKTSESTLYREVVLESRIFGETIHLIPQFNVTRVYAQDITDRKKAEEEISKALEAARRNEDQLRVLIQNVGSAVALVDDTGRFSVVNRAFLDIFGLNAESDILNVNSQDWSRWEVYGEDGKLLHVDDHPVRKAAITGKPVKSQLVAVRNPGAYQLTWVLINAEPLLREDASVYMVICTYHDITERKLAEEALRKAHDELEVRVRERTAELRQAYDRLKEETEERAQIESQLRQAQKMEALGTMSGGIAHDFNNILAAIIGFTELLEGHTSKGSRDARHLHRIMEAGIRGRELVRQMLTFSRKAEQEKKPLALGSIVKETVKLIRATTPSTISNTSMPQAKH